MDPLTHALAGATVAWAATGTRLGRRSLAVGAAAALLPDLDVLIRSASDPLLAIEHHRGFTHSLLFALPGGTLSGLLFGGRAHRTSAMIAGILAWLSHALLDASTTFGTQLFWPFSRQRIGLDVISIIDPLFTLIAVAGVIAAIRSARRTAFVVTGLMFAWLAIGFVQRERASRVQIDLAETRGHTLARGAVFPTVGNTIVWRSIYESGGVLHTDRVRVPWFGNPSTAGVDAVPAAHAPDHPAMRREYERFAWFADQWIAPDPADPSIIGDARYSMVTDRYVPVWGIRFDDAGRVAWVDRSRQRRVSPRAMWNEILGTE